ncbi:hypothetical protein [Pyruvatibacter sp.]|uniref:hypothetical protein n=1 Tax=Pyruvatibacter sp. TaxID=1981328 RepID=UPI0032EDA5A6
MSGFSLLRVSFKTAAYAACITAGAALLSVATTSSALAARSSQWVITKDHWSESDERGFSEFVTALGEADCYTMNDCLKSPANPYRATDPWVKWYADCADMPYMLRAYYAWKNGLPFSYQTAMRSGDGAGSDIRYSMTGNQVVARRDARTGTNAVSFIRYIPTISTGMYRHHAAAEAEPYFTDHYSPAINRDTIRPGTVVYDVNGHVTMVYKVTEDGRVLTLAAHPDQSLSRSYFGRNFLRTQAALGTGFKNWRPIKLVGYKRAANGTLYGGRVVGVPNADLPDFSLEQYAGTEVLNFTKWYEESFTVKGQNLNYYEWVRASLSVGDLKYRPVRELRAMLTSLCQDASARKHAVDIAIKRGIHRYNQPGKLPDNIYGTTGIWESYSTPSRDARLKTSFKETYDLVQNLLDMHASGDPKLAYEGTDIAGDLMAAFYEESHACDITYDRSNGQKVHLNLEDVMNRLWDMSFDPYHCIERRWGASDPAELASCNDGPLKTAWYEAEQHLRYQIDRTYDVDMGHDLASLQAPGKGLYSGRGVEAPPEVNIPALLARNLATKVEARNDVPVVPVSTLPN